MPSSEPKLIQAAVTCSAGGKVAIEDYNKVTSDYFVSASRTYSIPADWSDEQIDEFQIERIAEVRALVDSRANAEFDERWEQSYLNPER